MIRINLAPKGGPRVGASHLAVLPWKKLLIGSLVIVVGYSVWLVRENHVQLDRLSQLQLEYAALQRQLTRLELSLLSLRALQSQDAILKAVKSPEAQWAPRLDLLSNALVPQVWFTYMRFGPLESKEKQTPAATPQESANPASLKSSGQGKTSSKTPHPTPPPPPEPPTLVLKGSAFVTDSGDGPVTQFVQRLKEHPDFQEWFGGVDLRSVEHKHIKEEEVSDFEIVLRPKEA